MSPKGQLLFLVLVEIVIVHGWILENQEVSCNVTVLEGRLHWSMISKGKATVSQIQPTPLPSWTVNGVPPSPLSFQATYIPEKARQTLLIAQTTSTPSLSMPFLVYWHFVLYEGFSFLKIYGNTSLPDPSPAVFVDSSELLVVNGGPCNTSKVLYVNQWDWVNWEQGIFGIQEIMVQNGQTPLVLRMGAFPAFYGTRTSSGWASLSCADMNFVVGLQFNGKMTTKVWVEENALSLHTELEDLNHTLATYAFPGVFIGLYEGDDDEAGYRTQRFVEETQAVPLPDDNYPYVQYDSWQWGLNITEELLMKELLVAQLLGIEVFVLDLGWAEEIGNWVPDPVKFPNTLRPLVDAAHSYGIKFGLHIPLAQADLTSPIIQANPDWVAYKNQEYFGATGICLGHTPARDWIIKQIKDLIDQYNIDYFVQDGEDMVKHCTKSTHSHNLRDSNYANSVEGLDYVWTEIRKYKPSIILENCEDGGAMLTQKVPLIYDTTINTDNAPSNILRPGIYGNTFAFSPRYNARYVQEDLNRFSMRSGMFGGPLILQQRLSSYNSTKLEEIGGYIQEYKRFRKLIRDGKVIHLQRPTEYDLGWDAIQSVSEGKNSSVVFVYRALGGEPSWTVLPRGLEEAWGYMIYYINGDKDPQKSSGYDIMQLGIPVLLQEHDSQILYLEKLN